MAILITGGAGYIGSVTVELLRSKGEAVVVLDDLVRGHRSAVAQDVTLYQGKIGDRALLARILNDHAIESCIHFAALAYVGESVGDPATYFENNVAQGVALLGGLLQGGVRRVVFSSTCATYGEAEQIPITERCPQWPKNPYGWSKLFLEQLLRSYDTAYGMKFVALRYFNAAGATEKNGDDHRPETHLIPNIISAALGELPYVSVFGDTYPTPDGSAIRDYIHVTDLAEAHVLALESLRGGAGSDVFNLGTSVGSSVFEVIEHARQVTGRPIVAKVESHRPGDPARLVADPAKAREVLGWRPAHSDLRSIIRSAWEWRLKHPKGYV